LYDFNSLFFPSLRFGRVDVASDAPDFPTWFVGEEGSNGSTLDNLLVTF